MTGVLREGHWLTHYTLEE